MSWRIHKLTYLTYLPPPTHTHTGHHHAKDVKVGSVRYSWLVVPARILFLGSSFYPPASCLDNSVTTTTSTPTTTAITTTTTAPKRRSLRLRRDHTDEHTKSTKNLHFDEASGIQVCLCFLLFFSFFSQILSSSFYFFLHLFLAEHGQDSNHDRYHF